MAHDINERAGRGLLSRFLGAVFLVVLGGLLLLDRALLRANRDRSVVDAQTASLVVQSFVTAEATVLDGIAAIANTPGAVADSSLLRTTGARIVAHAPNLKSVLVVDNAGQPWVEWTTPESADARKSRDDWQARLRALYPSVDRLTLTILRKNNGEPVMIALVEPINLASAANRGHAVLLFDVDELRSRLKQAPSDARRTLTVFSGADTVLTLGRTGAGSEELAQGYALVQLPTGGTWRVETAHSVATRSLRVTLWLLGVLGVSLLGLGLLREQRRSLQAASRSAELERLYSDVKRANEAKSEFLANVSHELRTPLNAIVGFVELLHDGYYGDLSPRQALPVDRISASATHLRHLVDQVLDIAKIAAGRLEIHREAIVLRAFVINVASELESLIGEKNLSFAITISASLPRVRTDPTHLRQILINLIGNAVKYTPAGTISVRARQFEVRAKNDVRDTHVVYDSERNAIAPPPGAPGEGHWVALQVADTGVGIASKDLERIFDEFEQVNAGPRGDSMQRGTGLGLAISRRLARLLGGEITVESQLGQGATFTVWLSVTAADIMYTVDALDPTASPPPNDAIV